MEQLTAGVEPQHVVISSDDVSPSVSYIVKTSMQNSRVEVIIEDSRSNSSQSSNNSRLCSNVEVWYSLGELKIPYTLPTLKFTVRI